MLLFFAHALPRRSRIAPRVSCSRYPRFQMTPLKDAVDEVGVSQSTPHPASHPQDAKLDLYSEEERLKTFDTWDNLHIDKHALVAAGFYYTGVGDVVKCPYCKLEVGSWTPNDVPELEHRKYSGPSRCLYLLWTPSKVDKRPNEDPGGKIPSPTGATAPTGLRYTANASRF